MIRIEFHDEMNLVYAKCIDPFDTSISQILVNKSDLQICIFTWQTHCLFFKLMEFDLDILENPNSSSALTVREKTSPLDFCIIG